MDGRPVDLARARREAKALLRAARAGDAAARERMAGGRRPAPRRCGSPTRSWRSRASSAPAAGPRWSATRRRARWPAASAPARFVEWATSARREEAEALLALDPELARARASTPRWCSATSSA